MKSMIARSHLEKRILHNVARKSTTHPNSLRAFSAANDSSNKNAAPKPKIDLPTRKQFTPRERSVPASPTSRLVQFGGLAARLAVGVVGEAVAKSIPGTAANAQAAAVAAASAATGVRQQGVLSEASANIIAETLCKMRGAALKIGQTLSMQDESVVPPVILRAMERARQNADVMPRKQLETMLETELGADWRGKLKEFDYTPIAAASIGQVHKGVLLDGTEVAIKVQYPGVAESIDSDLLNVKRVLGLTSILPKGMFAENAMQELREDMMRECDYRREADCQSKFRELLSGEQWLYVPKVIDHMTTKRILTTELVRGLSIDEVAGLDQDTRNKVAFQLLRLCVKELFEYRFMQTDPNWSNFMYDPETGVLNLLDFGASREYSKQFVDQYLRIVYGAAHRDYDSVIAASRKLMLLTGDESKTMNDAHAESAFIIGEPFSEDRPYDFKSRSMAQRVRPLASTMLKERLIAPPSEIYSLHRKLSGAFMLCVKLDASISCRSMFLETYSQYKFDSST